MRFAPLIQNPIFESLNSQKMNCVPEPGAAQHMKPYYEQKLLVGKYQVRIWQSTCTTKRPANIIRK
jgi:hypothetical protein